jgi:hypothetical protein
MYKLLFVCFLSCVLSCERTCEEVASTQCYQNSVYVCNTNHRWEHLQSCNKNKCVNDGGLSYCAKYFEPVTNTNQGDVKNESVDAGSN